MPVRRTLLPVVDPADIEADKLEVQRIFESTNGFRSCRDMVVPRNALPGLERRLSSYGLIVYDSGEEWRPEDHVFVCCCHPACDGIFRLDRFHKDRSVTLEALVTCWKHLSRVHGVRFQ